MSHEDIAQLRRQVDASPKNLEIRAELYLEMKRQGLIEAKALEIAAQCKDPAAELIFQGQSIPQHRPITDDDLALLQPLPLLALAFENGFDGGHEISNKGLQALSELPLHSFCLQECEALTKEGLQYLAQCPIKTLDLSYCWNIGDDGLRHLKNLPLQKLILASCEISDEGLKHLQGLPIESLHLDENTSITDEGLRHLMGLPLKSLDLSGCSEITDQGLAFLTQSTLRSLNLWQCTKMTHRGLEKLRHSSLTHLNLTGCPITDEQLKALNWEVTIKR